MLSTLADSRVSDDGWTGPQLWPAILRETTVSWVVGEGWRSWGGGRRENLNVIYNENELGSDSLFLGHYVAI